MTSGYKRCINGHFYKDDISLCPYCGKQSNSSFNTITYKYDFFISYNQKDYTIIKLVVAKLREKGYKVFFYDIQINPVDEDPSQIIDNLNQSCVVLSISSIEDGSSPCVAAELKYAETIGKSIQTISINNKADNVVQQILDEIPIGGITTSKTTQNCISLVGDTQASKTMFFDDDYSPIDYDNNDHNSTYHKELRTTKTSTFNPTTRRIAGTLRNLASSSHTYLIFEGDNLIGRDKYCNITIDESTVSSTHALLLFRHGKYFIQDQLSVHGTYVNGECIELNTRRCINNGDIIRIGNNEFEFDEFVHYQNDEEQYVYSSVFAPAEINKKTHMLIQVYLHLFEETEIVKSLAQESQKDAVRRDYIPLQCKVKKDDKVDVLLNIYGEKLFMCEKKSLIWKGSFTKCSFDYYVPNDIDVSELCCLVMLTVNGAIVGEMRFITKIVEQPKKLNPEVFAHQYHKIFISYAHQDIEKVEPMARAYQAQGVDYFFDRHKLKPGDIFPMKIQEFIDTADLFILCWSTNAAKSKYVELERQRALRRAFPQVQPIENAKLSIYPISFEPRAELPADMIGKYNFEVV